MPRRCRGRNRAGFLGFVCEPDDAAPMPEPQARDSRRNSGTNARGSSRRSVRGIHRGCPIALESEPAGEGQDDDQPSCGDEGPRSPLAFPTSLTAVLREQGPRYQHRVSRRTRRKGRVTATARPPGRGPAPMARRIAVPRNAVPRALPKRVSPRAPSPRPDRPGALHQTCWRKQRIIVSESPRTAVARRAPDYLPHRLAGRFSWSTCRR